MRKTSSWPVLLILSAGWIALFRLLGEHAVWLIPEAIRRELTLEAYLTIVQLVTLFIGVGVSLLVVADVRTFLGFPVKALPEAERASSDRSLALKCVLVILLAPAIYALTHALAVQIAVPTLLAEIKRGGRELAQSQSGQFGRELASSPLIVTLIWGALVSPVCEELLFRGALWSSLHSMWQRLLPKPQTRKPSVDPELDIEQFLGSGANRRSLGEWQPVLAATLATILVSIVFAALHADMPGGLGIVRTASALFLALACGFTRQITGHIVPAIALHATFNAVSIAATRRLLDSQTLGKWLFVPAPLWLGALLLLIAAGVVWALTRARSSAK